jgi:hypothetical protein
VPGLPYRTTKPNEMSGQQGHSQGRISPRALIGILTPVVALCVLRLRRHIGPDEVYTIIAVLCVGLVCSVSLFGSRKVSSSLLLAMLGAFLNALGLSVCLLIYIAVVMAS